MNSVYFFLIWGNKRKLYTNRLIHRMDFWEVLFGYLIYRISDKCEPMVTSFKLPQKKNYHKFTDQNILGDTYKGMIFFLIMTECSINGHNLLYSSKII